MPSAQSEDSTSSTSSSTAVVTRSSGSSVSRRELASGGSCGSTGPMRARRWSTTLRTAIQMPCASSASTATPSRRRPTRAHGPTSSASEASGVSSAIAAAPMPASATTKRASESTMAGRALAASSQ